MKNKIKEIHNKLSQNEIKSFDSVISASSFNSVLRDRFISELKKNNIIWDLSPTTINKLVNANNNISSAAKDPKIEVVDENINRNFGIGIDIQFIGSMPISKDPWEDQFYIDNFNKNEISHCLKKKNIYESFAGIFALKEAIYKIDKTEKLDIKITFSKDGKPLNDKYSISISHDNDYAIAVAILYEKQNNDLKFKDFNDKIQKKIRLIDDNLNSTKYSKKDYIIFFMIISIILYLLLTDFFLYLF
jgi:phosphopantetheine--protein transferase-like protein